MFFFLDLSWFITALIYIVNNGLNKWWHWIKISLYSATANTTKNRTKNIKKQMWTKGKQALVSVWDMNRQTHILIIKLQTLDGHWIYWHNNIQWCGYIMLLEDFRPSHFFYKQWSINEHIKKLKRTVIGIIKIVWEAL